MAATKPTKRGTPSDSKGVGDAVPEAWPDPVERIIAGWKGALPEVDTSPLRVIARIARIDSLITPHLREPLALEKLNIGLFDVLAALRRIGHPYRSTPTDLAASTMLTTGGMTGRVDQLEAAGLVERQGSELDRRVTHVVLTPLGVEVVDRALLSLLETERRLLQGVSAARVRRLAEDLADLERSIQEMDDPEL